MVETMQTISVITPIFKGKRYLQRLKGMILNNSFNARELVNVEWIIVNDDPAEKVLTIQMNEGIKILSINHKKNVGIQRSRIDGILSCSGDYVVLLDQDDRIWDEYISEQYSVIKAANADAVVCDLKNDGVAWYGCNHIPSIEDAIRKETMLKEGNQIISPGQVLIRRESIPKLWLETHLQYNGSDDNFLWLCMLAMGCRFITNPSILYERNITGKNASFRIIEMRKSSNEVIDLLLRNNIFSGEDAKLLESFKEKQNRAIVGLAEKDYKIIKLLDRIYKVEEEQYYFINRLSDNSNCNLGIYGYGIMGKIIGDLLRYKDFYVKCFIDQNAGEISKAAGEIIVCPDQIPGDVDVIIVTIVSNSDLIKKSLEKLYPAKKVYTLEEILYDSEFAC